MNKKLYFKLNLLFLILTLYSCYEPEENLIQNEPITNCPDWSITKEKLKTTLSKLIVEFENLKNTQEPYLETLFYTYQNIIEDLKEIKDENSLKNYLENKIFKFSSLHDKYQVYQNNLLNQAIIDGKLIHIKKIYNDNYPKNMIN